MQITEDKMHFVQFPDPVLIIKHHKALYFEAYSQSYYPIWQYFLKKFLESTHFFFFFYYGKLVHCFHKLHRRINPQHVHPESLPCLVINPWNRLWQSVRQRERFKVWDSDSFLSDLLFSYGFVLLFAMYRFSLQSPAPLGGFL